MIHRRILVREACLAELLFFGLQASTEMVVFGMRLYYYDVVVCVDDEHSTVAPAELDHGSVRHKPEEGEDVSREFPNRASRQFQATESVQRSTFNIHPPRPGYKTMLYL